MNADKLRALQTPLKDRYRAEPHSAIVQCHAEGRLDVDALKCCVPTHNGSIVAGLHSAAGGTGEDACSGDMLLQSLVACAGVTFSAVASSMEIDIHRAEIKATGTMDFRGTLGIDKSSPVGFQSIELTFSIDSAVEPAKLDKLIQLVERYCVILQTLKSPPTISSKWERL